MNSFSEIRREWGDSDFQTAGSTQIDPLPLTAADKILLGTIGLPVSPKKALTLQLRFETVFIHHQPHAVRLLEDADMEKGPLHLSPGSTRPNLDSFVVLGRVVDADNDEHQDLTARRPYEASRRLVCVDGVNGHVWWLYPELCQEQIWCHTINTSFGAYLASLLAYKRFRDRWKDLPAADLMGYDSYDLQAEALHQEFLAKLEAADPAGFKGGFWEEHAWNEHILLHS